MIKRFVEFLSLPDLYTYALTSHAIYSLASIHKLVTKYTLKIAEGENKINENLIVFMEEFTLKTWKTRFGRFWRTTIIISQWKQSNSKLCRKKTLKICKNWQKTAKINADPKKLCVSLADTLSFAVGRGCNKRWAKPRPLTRHFLDTFIRKNRRRLSGFIEKRLRKLILLWHNVFRFLTFLLSCGAAENLKKVYH